MTSLKNGMRVRRSLVSPYSHNISVTFQRDGVGGWRWTHIFMAVHAKRLDSVDDLWLIIIVLCGLFDALDGISNLLEEVLVRLDNLLWRSRLGGHGEQCSVG